MPEKPWEKPMGMDHFKPKEGQNPLPVRAEFPPSKEARAKEKEEALRGLVKRRTQAMLDGNTEEVDKIGQAIKGLREE